MKIEVAAEAVKLETYHFSTDTGPFLLEVFVLNFNIYFNTVVVKRNKTSF